MTTASLEDAAGEPEDGAGAGGVSALRAAWGKAEAREDGAAATCQAANLTGQAITPHGQTTTLVLLLLPYHPPRTGNPMLCQSSAEERRREEGGRDEIPYRTGNPLRCQSSAALEMGSLNPDATTSSGSHP